MAEPEQQHNQCLTGVVITADEDLNSPACPGVTELMVSLETPYLRLLSLLTQL